MAMLRFQEYERATVDTEGAMGLAAILAGQLPELKGKRCLKPLISLYYDPNRVCVTLSDEPVSRGLHHVPDGNSFNPCAAGWQWWSAVQTWSWTWFCSVWNELWFWTTESVASRCSWPTGPETWPNSWTCWPEKTSGERARNRCTMSALTQLFTLMHHTDAGIHSDLHCIGAVRVISACTHP